MMIESSEELLADIDATLDQLLKNAQALKEAESDPEFATELPALEKAQESLLARLMHRQSILDLDHKEKILKSIKKEEIHQKAAEYAKSLKPKIQKRASLRKARSRSRG